MTITVTRAAHIERAEFETTRRLLACLINEGLVDAVWEPFQSANAGYLSLKPFDNNHHQSPIHQLKVTFECDSTFEETGGNISYPVAPGQLQPPVALEGKNGRITNETNPSKILHSIQQWFSDCSPAVDNVKSMLQNSADNQEKWLQLYNHQGACSLDSPTIGWEHTIIFGHPEHPFHRCFYPVSSLLPAAPNTIEEFLSPEISLISIPDTELRLTGPFKEHFYPLLQRLSLPRPSPGRTIVPCFTKQWPLISKYLPKATLEQSVQEIADTQVSTRSVSIKPEFDFNYHLKMSLSYQITAATRNVKPWQALQATWMTDLVERLAPPNLWVYREVATVTGATHVDFATGQTFSCILREDLEPRAMSENQALIISAALYHNSVEDKRTYAEVLFDLESVKDKCSWVRRYTGLLFGVVMPLLGHGVALEPHSQNILVRVDKQDRSLKGLAIRDMNGVKIHLSTLKGHGITVPEELAQIPETNVDKLEGLWRRVHRTLIQNNIAFILRGLGLDNSQGWSIVREELERVLTSPKCPMGSEIREYFWGQTMGFPCFFEAILRGKPMEFERKQLPNILLR